MGAFGRPFFDGVTGSTTWHSTGVPVREMPTPSAFLVATVRFPNVAVRLSIQAARRLKANRTTVLIRPGALAVDTPGLHTYDLSRRNLALCGLWLSRLRRRQSHTRPLAAIEPDVRAIGRTLASPLTNDKRILNGGCLRIPKRDSDLTVARMHDGPVRRAISGHQYLTPPAPAAGSEAGSASVQCGQFGLGHRCLVGHIHIPKPIHRAHARHRRRGKARRAGQRHHAGNPHGENRGNEAQPLQLHRDGVAAWESAKVVTGFRMKSCDTAL